MAGEWIKFEASTPEKQEVFSITVAMGWDDPDLTVGKLLKVWRWFDQQTVDGNAPRVTAALLDRIIGVTGFAQAMCSVGWLVSNDSGVSLPNFERHNGKTAKNRVLTAKRVANHKSNAKGNAHNVSEALPKEEKRREEDKQLSSSRFAPNGLGDSDSIEQPEQHESCTDGQPNHKPITINQEKKSRERGERLPSDWHPTPEDTAFCKTERPDLRPSEVARRFYDYWIAVPGAKGRKLNWSSTWRNWVRNESQGKAGTESQPMKKDWL